MHWGRYPLIISQQLHLLKYIWRVFSNCLFARSTMREISLFSSPTTNEIESESGPPNDTARNHNWIHDSVYTRPSCQSQIFSWLLHGTKEEITTGRIYLGPSRNWHSSRYVTANFPYEEVNLWGRFDSREHDWSPTIYQIIIHHQSMQFPTPLVSWSLN